MSLDNAIELIVAGLLVVTIGYCVLLNRKLSIIRGDKGEMRALITELAQATERAEQGINQLKTTAGEWDRALGAKVRRATELDDSLTRHDQTARQLVENLSEQVKTAQAEAAKVTRHFAVLEQRQQRALKRTQDEIETRLMGWLPSIEEATRGQRAPLGEAIREDQRARASEARRSIEATRAQKRITAGAKSSSASERRDLIDNSDLPLKPTHFDNDEVVPAAEQPRERSLTRRLGDRVLGRKAG